MKNKGIIAVVVGTVIALLVGVAAILLSDEKRRKKASQTLKELWGKAEKTVKTVTKKTVKKKK